MKESAQTPDMAPAKARMNTPLLSLPLQAVAIFVAYWVIWQTSGLFGVLPYVNAVYLSAGLTVSLAMTRTIAWFPVLFICIGASAIIKIPQGIVEPFDFLNALRQLLIYGGAGIILKQTVCKIFKRCTLGAATSVITVNFFASLLSAIIAVELPPYTQMPYPQKGSLLLSFWGGDFSGLMIVVPAVLLYRSSRRHGKSNLTPAITYQDLKAFLGLAALAMTLALFSAWIPHLLNVTSCLPILLLFGVTLAGLSRGATCGLIISTLACCVYLWIAKQLGTTHLGDPVEMQLTFAVSAVLAVLSGGAHDDRLYEWQQANYDHLTKLPNSRLLDDRLDQALRRANRANMSVGLLFIDLDRFKEVNDTYGHDIGDQLLIQVASRLNNCLRTTDTVARKSGDEFVVVVPDLLQTDDITLVAQKLIDALHTDFELGTIRLTISASIGVAVFPTDGYDVETLRINADYAMYTAKNAGRNQYALYRELN